MAIVLILSVCGLLTVCKSQGVCLFNNDYSSHLVGSPSISFSAVAVAVTVAGVFVCMNECVSLRLVRLRGIFWFFQLHFQSFRSNLKTMHCFDSSLC